MEKVTYIPPQIVYMYNFDGIDKAVMKEAYTFSVPFVVHLDNIMEAELNGEYKEFYNVSVRDGEYRIILKEYWDSVVETPRLVNADE